MVVWHNRYLMEPNKKGWKTEMKKKKIIQEIMGSELEPLGFAYENDNGQFYTYIRWKEEVKQAITICNERFTRNYLKMYFSTSAYGQKMKELEDFVPGIMQESWKYENEEEFREIVEQFRDWTLSYGLEVLEKMSVPTTEKRPKPETNRYLYEHHERLNEEYLRSKDLVGKDSIDVVFAIQDTIKELRTQSFNEAESTLIMLAAAFAHNMCLHGVGEWTWDEEYQVCEVLNVGEVKMMLFH